MTLSALDLLLAALGGGAGGAARWAVSGWAARRWGEVFPWGTMAVNVAGAALIGAAWALLPAGPWRLFVVAGVLGGFTTVSAFALQTVELVEAGRIGAAAFYVAATFGPGLLACVAAYRLAGGV